MLGKMSKDEYDEIQRKIYDGSGQLVFDLFMLALLVVLVLAVWSGSC